MPKQPKRDIEVDASLPASRDAERSILGAVFLNNDSLTRAISSGVRPEDFAFTNHNRIFQALCKMQQKGHPIDLVSFAEYVGKHLPEIGGMSYVSDLTTGVVVSNVEHYCRIVKDKAHLRTVIHACQAALADALAQDRGSEDIVADLENSLIKLAKDDTDKSTDQVAHEVFERIMAIRSGAIDPTGMTTSLEELDELTGGAHEGEYIVLAGRTSHGKSSMLRQMFWANAQRGKRVKLYSLEMTKANMIECLAATISGVEYDGIRNPRYLSPIDLDKIADAITQIKNSTLVIDDRAGMDVGELRARIRAGILQGDELVGVDYLQMVDVRGESDTRKRVSTTSAGLRDEAKQTKVPIIALSQLRRPEQGTENREPTIYELKESGDIENDAFQAWLIYRPKEKDEVTQRWKWSGEDWILVAKNRNGPLGNVPVVYRGPLLRFDKRTIEKAPEFIPIPESPRKFNFIKGNPNYEQRELLHGNEEES